MIHHTHKNCGQWNFGGSFYQKCLKLSTFVLLREFEFSEKPYTSEPGIKKQAHQWPKATFWKIWEALAPCKCFFHTITFFSEKLNWGASFWNLKSTGYTQYLLKSLLKIRVKDAVINVGLKLDILRVP